MHSLYERFTHKLLSRDKEGVRRKLLKPCKGADFASNDYLGHARSCILQKELAVLAEEQGLLLGSTGSRLLTGNSSLAIELEKELATAFNAEAALLFNSGYDLNVGFLEAVCEKDDVVLMDELAHASLKDGLKLSKASGYFFRHNDAEHLKRRLERLSISLKKEGQLFVVVESVYSMDGDLAPLPAMLELCEHFNAALIIDEAHGVGTIGAWGEGLVSSLGYEQRVFARIHTFGKAMGVHGAALLGSSTLIEFIVNYCHSFIYTTALPGHSLLALQVALAHLRKSRASFAELQQNIKYLNEILQLPDHPSPIYSFIFSDIAQLQELARILIQKDISVLPIYSPTVRKGSERLRVCLHSYNTRDEINALWEELESYEQYWEKPICNGH